MPTKKTTSDSILPEFTCPIRNNRYPTRKFNNAHTTFTVADESPLPDGLEKGEGNLFPETPWTKCGIALAKKIPAKKLAM